MCAINWVKSIWVCYLAYLVPNQMRYQAALRPDVLFPKLYNKKLWKIILKKGNEGNRWNKTYPYTIPGLFDVNILFSIPSLSLADFLLPTLGVWLLSK